jgi:hypothetical protein
MDDYAVDVDCSNPFMRHTCKIRKLPVATLWHSFVLTILFR